MQDVGGLNAGGKLPAGDRRFGMADLARHCNAFYRPILERELADLAERDYVHTARLEARRVEEAAAARENCLVTDARRLKPLPVKPPAPR